MAMAVEMVFTNALRPGQDHPEGVNVRKTDRDEGLNALVASISADGLLQPLLVWDDGGSTWVIDGSRRLAAMMQIRAAEPERFEQVPCLFLQGACFADAVAKSLAANIMQLPLHPVDQFEIFSQIRDGMPATVSPADAIGAIAKRYGMAETLVTQRLALGALHPVIRQAWRNDEIDRTAAESYTLESDPERQIKIFKKLKTAAGNRYRIREAIVGNMNASHLIAFVGAADYEAEGGKIIRDLFADDDKGDAVTDRALLQKMAEQKIDAKIADLTDPESKHAWAWAEYADRLPNDWQWKWSRDKLNAKAATEAQRAASGAVITIDYSGRFAIEYGVRKPGQKKPASAGTKAGKADKKPTAEETEIPNTMVMELQRAANMAIGRTMQHKPGVALAALVAGFADPHEGPVRVRMEGQDHSPGDAAQVSFAAMFQRAWKEGGGEVDQIKALTLIACAALDLGLVNDPMPLQEEGTAALVAALDGPALQGHLSAAFDPEAYFNGIPKILVRAFVDDQIQGSDPVPTSATRAELAELAAASAKATGWLPPELRTPAYGGPGAKRKAGRR